MSILGKRIKIGRKKIGVTQEELGKIVGVAKTTISGYERGSNAPDNGLLIKIADAFGFSTDYLLGRTDIQEPLDEKSKIIEQLKNINVEIIEIINDAQREGLTVSDLKHVLDAVKKLKGIN